MNGAQSLIQTLLEHGVDTCFANPGTSEMHLVEAIDAVDGMRGVLCLFEGVCTGAADGYARMAGKPATTLLHLGAGLGNGIANLHNARRAGTPLINIVGDHAIHHVAYDAPLTSDIEGVAGPVSAWTRTSRTAEGVAFDTADAVQAAMAPRPVPGGGISTLILPADCAWGTGRAYTGSTDFPGLPDVTADAVEAAARATSSDTVLMIDGNGLSAAGVNHAGRIAARTGASVFSTTFPARVESGPGLYPIARLPYFPEQIVDVMAGARHLVLAGGEAPVSFFAYRELPSDLVPEDCAVTRLAHRHENVEGALAALADALDAPAEPATVSDGARPDLPTGELTTRGVAEALAALAPDDSIVATDSGGGGAAFPFLQRSARNTWLNLTGGAIGQGGPAATGAAVACPDRPVFALCGDGGAMYTNQFLWTCAREKLNVTTIIFSNRAYNILEVEYRRLGINDIGQKAASLFDLSNPDLDWVSLAKGQGVPGAHARTGEELVAALNHAAQTEGPFLIEAHVIGR